MSDYSSDSSSDSSSVSSSSSDSDYLQANIINENIIKRITYKKKRDELYKIRMRNEFENNKKEFKKIFCKSVYKILEEIVFNMIEIDFTIFPKFTIYNKDDHKLYTNYYQKVLNVDFFDKKSYDMIDKIQNICNVPYENEQYYKDFINKLIIKDIENKL